MEISERGEENGEQGGGICPIGLGWDKRRAEIGLSPCLNAGWAGSGIGVPAEADRWAGASGTGLGRSFTLPQSPLPLPPSQSP